MNVLHRALAPVLAASVAACAGAGIAVPTGAGGTSGAAGTATTMSGIRTVPTPPPMTGARRASTSYAAAALSPAAQPAQVTEWRRVDRTALATLLPAMRTWASYGGTEMVIDVSFLVDLAEQHAPTAAAYAHIAAYVRAARILGLATSAVAGTPTWVHHRYVVDLLDASLDRYNAEHPAEAITSLAYDVEPWSTSEFGRDPQSGTVEFLAWVQQAMAAHDGISVGIFAPYWMDGRAVVPRLSFTGVTGTPAAHLARIVCARPGNFLTVMAYQATRERLLQAVPGWSGTGVPYRVGIEVGPSDAGSTWYGASRSVLLGQLNTVAAAQVTRLGFRGITVDSVTYLP